MSEMLTFKELAKRLGVSNNTVLRWEKAKLIKSQFVAEKDYRFDFDEVVKIIQKLHGFRKGEQCVGETKP